ncbi:MAG TPA: 2-oxoglutarate dehydrogenase E1 component [Candidatus Koribacter sp.]
MSTALINVANEKQERILDAFRRWGHLQANIDPIGHFKPVPHPDLEFPEDESEFARKIYCGTVGVEFMHIADPEKRRWIAEKFESEPAPVDHPRVLDALVRADMFEQMLQSRYIGTKRYSLEGNTSLIPLLHEILNTAAEQGAEQAVMAMSHRGRLNVIVNVVNRPAAEIFAGFEDVDPRSVLGGGDVKYHIGSTGNYLATNGKKVHIHLASNPSHLEAVNPVAAGRVRAKQQRIGEGGREKVVPLILHGDTAFAGQGIVAETLNLEHLPGFDIGGTVHVIANNLIGFTANPREAYSSRYSSDIAKRLAMPVIHVNAEDPDAVVRVGRIAMDYRNAFGSDVLVDLIGYRRHGHSEVDDPTITQPIVYRKIKDMPLISDSYASRYGLDPKPLAQAVHAEWDAAQKEGKAMQKKPSMRDLPDYWNQFKGGPWNPSLEVDTGLSAEHLLKLAQGVTSYPSDFNIHPKVQKLLEQRREMGEGKKPLDYGMAESLAFASLVTEGVPVRLSGQDTKRGTFNQRHAVLVDTENENEYLPLAHLAPNQAWIEIYSSELSEAAVMGFEYGFARDFPEALVAWEAQFGDFANGAQIIIDQFVVAGEDKWDLLSGVVLMLPHGHEGQGPEHSSARIERYLQLCARDNMQVCQPSNAAQYFHLLRRQALRKWRKPLICFTPKSMLRHPEAVSPLVDLTKPRFELVVPDSEVQNAERILLCTGKIGHEMRMERRRRRDTSTAILFLDQIYPFPEKELEAALAQHPNAREVLWVQEEPANMGALSFVEPRLHRLLGPGVRTIKRAASATPATGSHKAHELEQKTLINMAFTPMKS